MINKCGDCTLCCQGWLIGDAYGNGFYPNRPCIYLQPKCNIYQYRPVTCKNYFCAWSQGLFSDSLYPPISNVIISVEVNNNKQFLKVIETHNEIKNEVYEEIESFCKQYDTYYVKVPYEIKFSELLLPIR